MKPVTSIDDLSNVLQNQDYYDLESLLYNSMLSFSPHNSLMKHSSAMRITANNKFYCFKLSFFSTELRAKVHTEGDDGYDRILLFKHLSVIEYEIRRLLEGLGVEIHSVTSNMEEKFQTPLFTYTILFREFKYKSKDKRAMIANLLKAYGVNKYSEEGLDEYDIYVEDANPIMYTRYRNLMTGLVRTIEGRRDINFSSGLRDLDCYEPLDREESIKKNNELFAQEINHFLAEHAYFYDINARDIWNVTTFDSCVSESDLLCRLNVNYKPDGANRSLESRRETILGLIASFAHRKNLRFNVTSNPITNTKSSYISFYLYMDSKEKAFSNEDNQFPLNSNRYWKEGFDAIEITSKGSWYDFGFHIGNEKNVPTDNLSDYQEIVKVMLNVETKFNFTIKDPLPILKYAKPKHVEELLTRLIKAVDDKVKV